MFEGVYTALITPFDKKGQVDFACFSELIERQIAAGVTGIVPVGTTGESPTLNMQEHEQVIEAAIAAAAGRIKVIAGTGGNSTPEALELTRHAQAAGADGTLQVTPYYNKPSQQGLIEHFTAVADVGLPIILYNIPGRTARELTVETVVTLSTHPHIVAIKEAAGDVDRVSVYRGRCDIEVLSGDDPLTVPMMVVGGIGVISVASNIIPGPVTEMVRHALEGHWHEARIVHAKYHELFTALLTLDTNPIPVKTALAMMGQAEEVFRLPMCAMNQEHKKMLKETLGKYQISLR